LTRHGARFRTNVRGIPLDDQGRHIDADLRVPAAAAGLVLFAHGSGSSRFSRRNRAVAGFLEARGFATLLLDLLTSDEEASDVNTRQYRFDIGLLARRVVLAIDWVRLQGDRRMPIGCFGASTGAAAAIVAAAERPDAVAAVVSRGGRPDLAEGALAAVRAPTLLIVGGADETVIELNREATGRMTAATVALEIVPGATHLFEEPAALEQVMTLAAEWFRRYLAVVPFRDPDQEPNN
jgi:dienelactone hydrolase